MIRYYYNSDGLILSKIRFNIKRISYIAESYENSIGYIDHNTVYDIREYVVDLQTQQIVKNNK